MNQLSVAVIGSGIFGVTAAIELRRRGYAVQLLDPGPLPHPLAASTDISKAVRMEYGTDEDYATLVEQSFDGWHQWNRDFGAELYHETGVLYLRQDEMKPGTFEYESYEMDRKHGRRPERVNSAAIRARFPAWNADRYVDGIFHALGGYAESGKVVARLVERARTLGVELRQGQTFDRFIEDGSRACGVITKDGSRFESDAVVVAAGSWTPHILPSMAGVFRSNGMPVFHLQPDDPELFRAQCFPTFGADITGTGYYGFPLHPEAGVVKIANHGQGRELHPESPERVVTATETAQLREFLRYTFPALADAPIVYTRVCLYCDTWDGHFWIAPDPARAGVVVATGGSGHGYKFAPVLGSLIADAVEGKRNPYSHKFRWRPEVRLSRNEEEARFQK